MDLSGLSFDQAPPYHTVQRFFLTAPLFLILAGLLLLFYPGYLFVSYASFSLIGFLHLVTLGFITMSMMGAMMQMLPVVVGVKIKSPVIFSAVVHGSLTLGGSLLAIAYLIQWMFLVPFVGLFLFLAIGMFTGHIIPKLYSVSNVTDTVRAMRFSVISLVIVLIIGIIMLLWRMDIIPDLGVNLIGIHAGWALFGWVSLLIMGVSFQVLPMFYVAPEYPALVRRQIPRLIIIFLVFYLIQSFIPWLAETRLSSWIRISIFSLVLVFSSNTLNVLSKRKRKLPDPTLLFWKTAMVFLAISMSLAIFLEFYKGEYFTNLILLQGGTFLFGFICSLINGMMYKIVPFLSWFHLASKGNFAVPTMKEMISDARVVLQYFAWLLFLLIMICLVFYPSKLQWSAGISLVFSSGFLWWNLFSVIQKYARAKKISEKNQPV